MFRLSDTHKKSQRKIRHIFHWNKTKSTTSTLFSIWKTIEFDKMQVSDEITRLKFRKNEREWRWSRRLFVCEKCFINTHNFSYNVWWLNNAFKEFQRISKITKKKWIRIYLSFSYLEICMPKHFSRVFYVQVWCVFIGKHI